MKRKIYLIACLLFGVVFVVSAVQLVLILYRYKQADEVYEDIRDRYVMVNDGEPGQTSGHTSLPAPAQTQPKQETESNPGQVPETGRETTSDPAQTPDTEQATETENNQQTEPERVTDQAPIRVNFDLLLQDNSDVIGWLYCEDTVIHYPVVQSHDNDDYLRADLFGNYLRSGTLFADYRCGAVGTDQNHIIYGHTMKNGTMFGTLRNYKKQSYYDEHPVFYYLTPNQDYRIDLFAGLVTKSTSEFYYPNFQGTDGFEKILKSIMKKSTFKSNVSVTADDHIVMFSSCDYVFDNARYVVFGKLTPIFPSN